MGNFVHLHLHTEYSLLDGACRIKDIPLIAKEAGQTAVAVTDHGNLFGAVEFYKQCKANGVKPIIGCEVYVSPDSKNSRVYSQGEAAYDHLILLVKNKEGYKNLTYIVSDAYENGFYIKPRTDTETIKAHSKGLICLSACIAGHLPRLILKNDMVSAVEYAEQMQEIFGKGNYYLELQNHGIEDEAYVREGLKEIHKKTGIPFAATNDVHYLRKNDAYSQAVLMCLQTNSTLRDGKPKGFESDEFYFKTEEEMKYIFSGFEDAVENTGRIADMCDFDFEFGDTVLPAYPLEKGQNADSYLEKLARDGFSKKIEEKQIVFSELHPEKEYLERIDYELSVIKKMGYSDYYLIVWDFVNYARSHEIPTGPGRGSGAGSLVAYLIGITEINSIENGLLFERFLNPERVSMPDFDIDFSDEKRELVYEYVREKYGSDRVSHIITFGTLAARAAVRDVGRVMCLPYNKVAEVAEMIPRKIVKKNADGSTTSTLHVTLDMALKTKELNEAYNSDSDVKKLIDVSKLLEGMPRHCSTHAAGVVITDKPIVSYVPLAVTKGTLVTQFDMNTVAELGLLKFDFLGLRFLTVIRDTEKQIQKTERDFDINKIPLDDRETYRMISKGDTLGLFQLESDGMRNKLAQLKPDNIADIMAAIALYRPGPMSSISTYIENKRKKDGIEYEIPLIKPILEQTFGVMVYQEQVMQIYRVIADYSFGQADIIRKAMSKKQVGKIELARDDFIKGAERKGISTEKAESLFEKTVAFSNYAFNKSHAASYAVLSYQTAYLKCNYKGQYMASLLSSCLSNPDKVEDYTEECSKLGIKILPPDINESEGEFSFDGKNIRFALLAIKGIGGGFVDKLVRERETNGRFSSFEDFVRRMQGRDFDKKQAEMLIKTGCFDYTGFFRSQYLSCYEKIINDITDSSKNAASGQLDFFSLDDSPEFDRLDKTVYPDIPDLSVKEKLVLEKECAGFYFSGHILDEFSLHEQSEKPVKISDILTSFDETDDDGELVKEGTGLYKEKQTVTLCGIVTGVTPKNTKNGDRMAFVKLEDRRQTIELVVFPKTYENYGYLFTLENAVKVVGDISALAEKTPKILVRIAEKLKTNNVFLLEMQKKMLSSNTESREKNEPVNEKPIAEKKEKPKALYLRIDGMDTEQFKKTVNLIEIFEGSTEVVLYMQDKKNYIKVKGRGVDISQRVFGFFEQLLGKGNVIFK